MLSRTRAPRARLTHTDQWLQLSATLLFAAVLAVLLVLGIRGANQLQAASSALQLASQLSGGPQLVGAELTLIQRGLETTTYVGDSVRALAALRRSSSDSLNALSAEVRAAHLDHDPDVMNALRPLLARWQRLDARLDELRFQRGSVLYADTPGGSQLSAQGRAMKATVDELLAAQSQNLQVMGVGTDRLAAVLRAAVAESGLQLRALLLGGAAMATLLLGLMLYFGWRSRQSGRAAAHAERQVSNILDTVREGLFLLDRELRLGDTYSQSLCELLRIEAPAGMALADALKPLVDEKNVTAALKYLGLLWKDKVHEELIESVNPLNEIEISFTGSRGTPEVRYLAFSFRRVRATEESGDYILGVVADVTDRVLLARELENVKADSDSQASLQLQLLRVDPEPLRGFLASADVALRKSNAVMTASGIEQEDLKKKLNSVFRELHTIKGEAAALTLTSFVQRIHGIEEALSALRSRSTLTGNDFLPVVVRLDELLTHLGQIRAMQERVATLRAPGRVASSRTEPGADPHGDTTVLPGTLEAQPGTASATGRLRANPLAEMFRTLAQEVARDEARAVRVTTQGLEDVPAHYLSVVKDICIQMIRNSVTHGIEPPGERVQAGKPEQGTVQISFFGDVPEQYVLTVEDDGHGLNYEQIVDKALRLGLLNPQQAVALDRASVYRLIFQPGFSTSDQVSEHAGRGVGLDAVSSRVRECGGRIGVSTAAGRYTRFKVLLPRSAAAVASSAA
jgi:HPt (histidine-containing phosphotransfer) domain-containing protein/PAS domain-containing protein